MEGAFQPGAAVRLTSTHPGYEGIAFSVTIDRMEPERLFSWRWHPGVPQENIDYSKEPATLVEFRLDDVEGGTMVTVAESGFERISLARRAALIKENEGGWEYQVKSLEGYVSQTP